MNFLQCSSFLTICAVQQPCNIAAPPWLKSQLVSLFRAMWALARHQEEEAESLPSEEEDAIVAAAPQKSRPMPRTSLTPTAALRREWMQPPVAVTPDQDEAKDKDKPKNTRYSQKGPPQRKSPASSTMKLAAGGARVVAAAEAASQDLQSAPKTIGQAAKELAEELHGSSPANHADNGKKKPVVKAKKSIPGQDEGSGSGPAPEKGGRKRKNLPDQVLGEVKDPGGSPSSSPVEVQGEESTSSTPGKKVKKQKKLKRSLSFQSPKAKQAARPSPRSGDKKPRAPRGSVGTFAGHRPPKDPTKLEIFEEMKKEYYRSRAEAVAPDSQEVRKVSNLQKVYFSVMQKKMKELASEGVLSADRMRMAAAAWRAHDPSDSP